MILGYLVQLFEVDVLVKLLKDYLLLSELFLQIPDLLEYTLWQEDDLSVVLLGHYPGERARGLPFISLMEA